MTELPENIEDFLGETVKLVISHQGTPTEALIGTLDRITLTRGLVASTLIFRVGSHDYVKVLREGSSFSLTKAE